MIHYCSVCQTRVDSRELKRGRAVTVDGRTYCPAHADQAPVLASDGDSAAPAKSRGSRAGVGRAAAPQQGQPAKGNEEGGSQQPPPKAATAGGAPALLHVLKARARSPLAVGLVLVVCLAAVGGLLMAAGVFSESAPGDPQADETPRPTDTVPATRAPQAIASVSQPGTGDDAVSAAQRAVDAAERAWQAHKPGPGTVAAAETWMLELLKQQQDIGQHSEWIESEWPERLATVLNAWAEAALAPHIARTLGRANELLETDGPETAIAFLDEVLSGGQPEYLPDHAPLEADLRPIESLRARRDYIQNNAEELQQRMARTAELVATAREHMAAVSGMPAENRQQAVRRVIEALDEILNVDEHHAWALMVRGQSFLRLQQVNEARRDFVALAGMDSAPADNRTVALYYLVVLELREGRESVALTELARLAELAPESHLTALAHARIAARRNDRERVREWLAKADERAARDNDTAAQRTVESVRRSLLPDR